MLNRSGMATTKPVYTPLKLFIRLSKLNTTQSESEKEYMSRIPYANEVGGLIYVMVCTRSYLAQVISVVSRYIGKLGKKHGQTIK